MPLGLTRQPDRHPGDTIFIKGPLGEAMIVLKSVDRPNCTFILKGTVQAGTHTFAEGKMLRVWMKKTWEPDEQPPEPDFTVLVKRVRHDDVRFLFFADRSIEFIRDDASETDRSAVDDQKKKAS